MPTAAIWVSDMYYDISNKICDTDFFNILGTSFGEAQDMTTIHLFTKKQQMSNITKQMQVLNLGM